MLSTALQVHECALWLLLVFLMEMVKYVKRLAGLVWVCVWVVSVIVFIIIIMLVWCCRKAADCKRERGAGVADCPHRHQEEQRVPFGLQR